MEKIKNFFKTYGHTILFIGSIILLSVTLLYITCPNIDVDLRVVETHKTTNKY